MTKKQPVAATKAAIIEVSYRQTFNTGNFTSETIELKAVCNGEQHTKVLEWLRRSVFFSSKQSKKLLQEALLILNADVSESSDKLRWAEAVTQKRETRPWAECRKEYEG